jgi:hypothetical protein
MRTRRSALARLAKLAESLAASLDEPYADIVRVYAASFEWEAELRERQVHERGVRD